MLYLIFSVQKLLKGKVASTTWIDPIVPTMVLWKPVETSHLISFGIKMVKIIKNSDIFKPNIDDDPMTRAKKADHLITLMERYYYEG